MTRCIIDAPSNRDATRQSYDAFVAKSDPLAVGAATEVSRLRPGFRPRRDVDVVFCRKSLSVQF